MSMTKLIDNPMKSCRFHHAFSLGNTVQRRRLNLGMSVERAADLAGMEVSSGAPWRPGGFRTHCASCAPSPTPWNSMPCSCRFWPKSASRALSRNCPPPFFLGGHTH